MRGILLMLIAVLATVECNPLDSAHHSILRFNFERTRAEANRDAFSVKPILSVTNVRLSEVSIPVNQKEIDKKTKEALDKLLDIKNEEKRGRPGPRQQDNGSGGKIFKVDEDGHPGTVVEVDANGNVNVKTAEQAFAQNDPEIVQIRQYNPQPTNEDDHLTTPRSRSQEAVRRADDEDGAYVGLMPPEYDEYYDMDSSE